MAEGLSINILISSFLFIFSFCWALYETYCTSVANKKWISKHNKRRGYFSIFCLFLSSFYFIASIFNKLF